MLNLAKRDIRDIIAAVQSWEIKEFVLGHVYSYLEDLGEELPEFLLVGGDTNTVFEKLGEEGGNLDYKHEAINAFQQVMQRFSLVDSYRLKNPDKKEFTWETLNPSIIRERIDIIFVSSSFIRRHSLALYCSLK